MYMIYLRKMPTLLLIGKVSSESIAMSNVY